MKPDKIFIFLIAACVFFCALNTPGQRKTSKKPTAKSARVKKAKKPPKTISGGVVNGSALELVQPIWPKAAKSVNVYGLVAVEVLIGVDGNVITAKAVSGHPLLYSASIAAALRSRFTPMTLSDESVQVSGIINYLFIPDSWNWLEIGYALGNSPSIYYSFEILKQTFPAEFIEETQLLNQIPGNKQETQILLISLLQNKLDEKSLWFFSVGLNLAGSTQRWNLGGHTLDQDSPSLDALKFLIAAPPVGSSDLLLKEIRELIDCVEHSKTTEAFSILRELEIKFPLLGR